MAAVSVASSASCAAALSARCVELAHSHAPSHPLCASAARLAAACIRNGEVVPTDWRMLTNLRVRTSWTIRPADLVWLDDKVAQIERTRELLAIADPLHVPLLASTSADADDEECSRTRESVHALLCSLRSSGSGGLVVKPRHGHDAIGVTVWTAQELSNVTSEEATACVWQSMELALAAYDDSWHRECCVLLGLHRRI